MTSTLSKRQNGNPIPGVENLVNSLFEDSLQRFFGDNVWNEGPVSTGKVPVNIRETESEYQIDLVAPGCRKEDFKISLDEKLLTVDFSQQVDNTSEKVVWRRNEFVQPAFTRTFVIDDSVDTNGTSATYQDGILRISLGKKEQAKSTVKKIEIK
jgi:HSP20 family protein